MKKQWISLLLVSVLGSIPISGCRAGHQEHRRIKICHRNLKSVDDY